jgi:putative superfamily III holin-X
VTRPATDNAPRDAPSLTSMVADVASDVTRLLRQEVDLARNEIRTEAKRAVRGARSVAMGAFALHLFAVLVSVGGVFALGEVIVQRAPQFATWATALAAGAVAVVWLLIGLVLLASGRRRLRRISPIPRQTIRTLKEDISWLRKPIA